MSATEVVDNGAAVFDEADHPPTSKPKVLSERTGDEDNHSLNDVEVERDPIIEFDTSEIPLEKLQGDEEKVSAMSEDSAAVEAPTHGYSQRDEEEENEGAVAKDDEIPLKDPTDPLATLEASDSPLQLFESPNTASHNEFEATEPKSQTEKSGDRGVDSTGTGTIASGIGRVHEGEEPQLEVEQVPLIREPVFRDADSALEAETLAQNLPEDTTKPINGNPVNLEPDGPLPGVAALQTSSSVDSAALVDAAEETVLGTGVAEERATKSSFAEGAEDPISNVHGSISVIPDTVSGEATGVSHVNVLAVSTSSEETPNSVTPVLTDPIIGGEESTVGNIVTDGSSGEVQVHSTERIESEKHMHLDSNVREHDLTSPAEPAESHSNELGSSAAILVGEKPGADIVLGYQEDNAEGSHAIPVEPLTIVSAAALQHSVSSPLVEPTQIETGQHSLTLGNSEDIPTGQAASGNLHDESSLEEMPMNVSEALEPLVERSIGDAAIETENPSELEHESELIVTDEVADTNGQSKSEIVPALEESSVIPDKISETAYEVAGEYEAKLITESDVLGVILATGNVETVSADPNAETTPPISGEEASSVELEKQLAENVGTPNEVILSDGEKLAANNENTNTSSVEEVPFARDEDVGPLLEGHPSWINENLATKDESSKPESVLDTQQLDVKPDEKEPDIGFDNNLDVAETVVDSAAFATQSLETGTEQHLMTETGGIVLTNEDADSAAIADVVVAPASGGAGGEGAQVFSGLMEESSPSDTTVEGTIADDKALLKEQSIANLPQDEPVDLLRENSNALVDEFSNADPATSLIGSVVKDNSTDTVVQFLSSGEAISDAAINNQSTEMEEQPVLELQNQANQRSEVPQDEAADDSDDPTNEAVPAAAPEAPFAEDIVPAITDTGDSQDEFSSDTLGLEKPSLDQEIQLTELTTPSESAQIDVEKLVEVMPDSPNVGTATEDSSDLRVDVAEVERPESPWTPSYSVSNQGPDVTREEDISEIEQLPISDVATSAESSVPMVNIVPEESEPTAKIVPEESEPTAANPEERKEPSRPSSPWVPSYAVSVQGSPSLSAHNSPITPGLDFPNKESPARPAESSIDVPEINIAIPSAGLDQPPEVPSEVHLEITENLQEPVSMIISDEEVPVADFSLQGKLDTEDVSASVVIEDGEGTYKNEDTTEPAEVVNAVGAEEINSEVGAGDSLNLSANTTEIDRPKSPWTPSYSVINQGPDMAREEDIPEIQQLPSSNVPAGQELPVPEVNIIPEVSEATVANLEEPKESSRPSSPWVPSYSVSVQGSPSVSAHSSPVLAATELSENVIPVIELSEESAEPASPVSAEVSALNNAAESIEEPGLEVDSLPPVDSVIHDENSVIPSVNITETSSESSLDIPLESTEADIAQKPMQDQTVNTVSSVEQPLVVNEMLDQSGDERDSKQEIDTPVLKVPDEEAIVDLSAKPYKDVEIPGALSPSQSVVAAQIERPKSPWGSYEVTNQSGHETSVAEMVDPEAVEAVEDIPAPTSFIRDEPVLEPAEEPTLKDVSTEDAPAAEVSKLTVDTTENDLPERPKSPWTPSYSVSRQGSQVFNEARNDAELDTLEQPPPHAESSTDAPVTLGEPSVPGVIEESVSAPSGETFPVLSVSGDIDRDTVGDTLAAPKDRKRLESTTSSLFFPGGWFSKPPTGRTSLDNAQGVITSPKAVSPVEGRSSVELLGGSSAPVSATADITNEGPDEDKEKKGKWCVIM